MNSAASGTVALPVSLIAGPAAGFIANQVWQTGNANARVGLLSSSGPGLAQPELSSRLFRLTSAHPEEISNQISTIAAAGELDHLIIQCDEAQPLMAYASLFAKEPEDRIKALF